MSRGSPASARRVTWPKFLDRDIALRSAGAARDEAAARHGAHGIGLAPGNVRPERRERLGIVTVARGILGGTTMAVGSPPTSTNE